MGTEPVSHSPQTSVTSRWTLQQCADRATMWLMSSGPWDEGEPWWVNMVLAKSGMHCQVASFMYETVLQTSFSIGFGGGCFTCESLATGGQNQALQLAFQVPSTTIFRVCSLDRASEHHSQEMLLSARMPAIHGSRTCEDINNSKQL